MKEIDADETTTPEDKEIKKAEYRTKNKIPEGQDPK